MASQFPIQAVNGAQVVPIPGGAVGTHSIYLAFTTAPSAGTVTVESRQIGSSIWQMIQGGDDTDITSGELALLIDGSVAALRVTFADLVDGASPLLWLSTGMTAWPPSILMTDGGFGNNSRLRVDQGQTGFFERKMWRLSHEFTGLDATPLVLKVVIPVNFIIHHQGLTVDEGGIGFRAYRSSQGTEGGTFPDVVPMYSVNFMDEMDPYTFQGTVHTGGTFTPSAPPAGVSVETIRVRTSGATAQQTTVGASAFGERGLLFDTYFLVLAKLAGVSGTSAGVYTLIVEERP
jgi:hypothetical protein